MDKKKVLFIGMDGATWEVIRPMIAEGRLPNLAALINSGTCGELASTVPCISPVAWTSLMTGKNPGKHGIYDFLARQSNSYSMRCNSSTSRRSKAIWNLLSEAGRAVGVVDLILTYPPEEVNGFILSGLGSPDRNTPFTYPPQLGKDILKNAGSYVSAVPFAECLLEAKDEDEAMERFVAAIFAEIENREKIISYLMQRYPWDFLGVVFQTTDLASHYCWKYMDKTHPAYDHEKGTRFGQTIYNVYERIDKAIGRFLQQTDRETTVLVASDHGFGPLHKTVLLNNLLERLGYLKVNRSGNVQRLVSRFLSKVKKLLRNKRDGAVSDPLAMIDWSETTAYSEGTVGNIFINLKGREPQGIVNDGPEYEGLLRRLSSDLSTARDGEHGETFIKRIYTREELFGTAASEGVPDLFLDFKDGYSAVGSFNGVIQGVKKGNREVVGHNSWWSGNHTPAGIFIVSGPSVRKGQRIHGARIIDVTPTILYLMGADIPQDVDGSVLVDAVERERLSVTPPTYAHAYAYGRKDEQTALSDEDDEKVKEKLRGLGYLD